MAKPQANAATPNLRPTYVAMAKLDQSRSTGGSGAPTPTGVRDHDDLAGRLRELRAWTGVGYRALHRKVIRARRARGVPELPSYNTVYRCFQAGRVRIDVDLVVDIAAALAGPDVAVEWRRACQVVMAEADESAIVAVEASLPDDSSLFVGRVTELAELIDTAAAGCGRAATIAAIEGMAGVGKTRLAVRAAHRLLETGVGADLVLAVNLRGFDPSRPPADPAAVLDGFLRLLGMPGSRITPLSLDERTAAFRRLLEGKRSLLLLDNAAGVDQVRPLLPGLVDAVVVVTSRRSLAGVTGSRLRLGAFDEHEALAVLRATSPDRVADDDLSASLLVEMVGGLPLGVALVAAQLAGRPGWTLADQVEQLVERRSLLRMESELEAALSLSYDALTAVGRRLLRALALHPGLDADEYAAAALGDQDLVAARATLAELAAASLLTRKGERVELHDLVRVFALARAHDEDPPRSRRAALDRLLDHYYYTGRQALAVYAPFDGSHWPALAEPPTAVPVFADVPSALDWFDAEADNLMVVARYAAEHDRPEHKENLSRMLFRYLNTAGRAEVAELLHGLAAGQLGRQDQPVILTAARQRLDGVLHGAVEAEPHDRPLVLLEHHSEQVLGVFPDS